ncbi:MULTISPECIES: sugar ABC transporter ATP-binding protein [unclassified Rhizobium]|uniref:sugar ABC transporter ATP-binding protein n=1 Tax=unclassified Rhizobium TaxID=2613769 RepID=UPI001AD9D522|nr:MULTISPECIES: sugar ABC transporter ATP-binding protein [unclassified Rhizobium]MBO9123767.1 sugar ABC transporter ATP-binding protein [Rhizobium sp. 16-488-2b]MBO9174299.1 sugar ABC transporter ATP-binding protein [Rhizobium sp. 16-488-2a]
MQVVSIKPTFDGLPRPIVQLRGLRKVYGGVVALDAVDLMLEKGKVHAILGENGAGKSTLIKILAGVTPPTAGEMVLDGEPRMVRDPRDAVRRGIACVFQELSLIPDLSVADNIFLDSADRGFGFFSRRAQRRAAAELLAEMGCENIDPGVKVRALPLPQAQLVEIAKALAKRPRVLILDESTSALGDREVKILFSIVRKLKSQDVAIVYISHRMHEIKELADTCSVFRNGRSIATFANGTRSEPEIISMMIGRDISQVYPPKPKPKPKPADGTPVLSVRDLRWHRKLAGVSFEVRQGEIYGIGGLDGQGQKETLEAIYGVLRGVSGEISIGGRAIPKDPKNALSGNPGVALIPEDRKTEGLQLSLSIADNLIAASLGKVSSLGVIRSKARTSLVDELVRRLQIKVGSVNNSVDTLSGGNQQKVVIAKFLATRPDVLLLSDPTRGIDVGTKSEIYKLLRQLTEAGAAIVLHSTDYDELIGLADRVGVFYQGRIVRELGDGEITEEAILAQSFGIEPLQRGARQ